MSLSILEGANQGLRKTDGDQPNDLGALELAMLLTPFDIKRLDSYANNLLDYHVVLDLLPTIASLYFQKRLGDELRLSAVQSSILLAIGLQRKTIEEVEAEIQLPVSQALALFAKVIRKITNRLQEIRKAQINAEMSLPKTTYPEQRGDGDEELREAGTNGVPSDGRDGAIEVVRDDRDTALREKQREMIQSLDLSKYAIDNRDIDWEAAEAQVSKLATSGGGTSGKSTLISVKSAVASSNVGAKRKVPEDVEGVGGNDKKKTRRGGGGKKAKR